MLLVTLSFKQRKAPVAVLSVAANSRGMSLCRTKDEMFFTVPGFSLRNHNPLKATVVTRHANVAHHTNVLYSFCHKSRFNYKMFQKIYCEMNEIP